MGEILAQLFDRCRGDDLLLGVLQRALRRDQLVAQRPRLPLVFSRRGAKIFDRTRYFACLPFIDRGKVGDLLGQIALLRLPLSPSQYHRWPPTLRLTLQWTSPSWRTSSPTLRGFLIHARSLGLDLMLRVMLGEGRGERAFGRR